MSLLTHFTYFTVLIGLFGAISAKPISQYSNMMNNTGVAFAFTGSGGRLGQLNAIAQSLINGTYSGGNGVPVIPSYLAGVSGGAITAVGINAALETMQQNVDGGFTYGDFNELLANTTDSDIFIDETGHLTRQIRNLNDGYLLDSSPIIDYLGGILSRIGYSTLGDLYLPTYITVVDQRSGINLRMLSTDPRYSSLPLLDVLVATTAIPIAFPPRLIPALTPNTQFIDGGTGIDYVPVTGLLSLADVDTIYVITYNNAFGTGMSDDSADANHGALVYNAVRWYDIQGANLAVAGLNTLAASNVTGYVYSPSFSQTFATTDFESMGTQFDLASQWAQNNGPTNVRALQIVNVSESLPTYTDPGFITAPAYDMSAGESLKASMFFVALVCVVLQTL